MIRAVVSKGHPIVLLALALVLSSVQCAAYCAQEPCDSAASTSRPADVPPCHQHHEAPSQKTPVPCSHQPVLAHAAQSFTTQVSLAAAVAALPVLSGIVLPSRSGAGALTGPAVSTFILDALSPVVLRI